VANTSNNWLGVSMKSGRLADTLRSKKAVPFSVEAVATHTAEQAYTLVLQKAGCIKPDRDTLDARVVADVQKGTGRIIDVQGGFPHATAFDQTVMAWPVLRTGTPPADTDKDGMPDDWEKEKGLDPQDASDGKKYSLSTGYTNVEVYINSLAAGVY